MKRLLFAGLFLGFLSAAAPAAELCLSVEKQSRGDDCRLTYKGYVSVDACDTAVTDRADVAVLIEVEWPVKNSVDKQSGEAVFSYTAVGQDCDFVQACLKGRGRLGRESLSVGRRCY